ncbi:HNH endonuclease [Bacillus marinisedimentorum]|uniref:HNH endonuclease n=1 Tax=Bacillus marinisedimentorum TaxID=1821260 RepID=UPI0008720956|nr:HNH endonuclease domain-containing protein [Bacillus marinisedimentorum]
MEQNDFETKDFWRAIILYGLNQATYKIALGQCLYRLAEKEKNKVTMHDLAVEFFEVYYERLKNNKPQLLLPNRRTVMERIMDLYNLGSITKEQAIERVEREAFGDVVPRFHTVNNLELPVKFYERTNSGLILTDSLFRIFSNDQKEELLEETSSRWDLLEAAFEIRRENSQLTNDIRKLYLINGYERTDITHTRPVLNGYQNGICFYCGEKMLNNDIHVDHVLPRQFIYHDEIWNLVLAHGFCNEQKSDALPDRPYVDKLILRNEHFIASNHPIKKKLIAQLGKTPKIRANYVYKVYQDAKQVLGFTWEGIRGYNPATDKFYRTFVRSISK